MVGVETISLSAAIGVVVAEHRVSRHLLQRICEHVQGEWNHEVTMYKSAHPEFQSLSVATEQSQPVLPVSEALRLAPKFVALGLRRVHQEAAQAWADLQLEGDLSAEIYGEIKEEE